jgi:hypothetical protein
MDPIETDEDKAFGPELASLREEETGHVTQELDNEIKELTKRLTYARCGQQAMLALSEAESAAAERAEEN